MVKLNAQVAQALVSLRGNSDFDIVLRWIAESRKQETDTCTKHDGPPLYRAQGAVSALTEIEKSFAAAPELVKKFSSQ